jgi:hypothetical protein
MDMQTDAACSGGNTVFFGDESDIAALSQSVFEIVDIFFKECLLISGRRKGLSFAAHIDPELSQKFCI